jgi:hypothetical protein
LIFHLLKNLERSFNVLTLMRGHYGDPQAGRSWRHCGRADSLHKHAALQKFLRKLHAALSIANDHRQYWALKII